MTSLSAVALLLVGREGGGREGGREDGPLESNSFGVFIRLKKGTDENCRLLRFPGRNEWDMWRYTCKVCREGKVVYL